MQAQQLQLNVLNIIPGSRSCDTQLTVAQW